LFTEISSFSAVEVFVEWVAFVDRAEGVVDALGEGGVEHLVVLLEIDLVVGQFGHVLVEDFHVVVHGLHL